MRPLAELDPRAPLRGLFTDVDDTLTHDGVLVPAAYDRLCRLCARGLKVVLVTGRPAGWAAVLAATWPIDAAVAENGAVAWWRGGALHWEDEATRAAHARRLGEIRDEILASEPAAKLAEDQWLRLTDVAFDIGERQRLAPDQIERLTARIAALGARTTVSTVHAHVFFSDVDKAKMCARLAATRWGVDLAATRDEWIFAGDSPNDEACFAFFPRSVGVANVARYADRLQPPPAFVTTRPGGHGFAELADHLLR
jgi:hypothetical protein